tara:strand:+ start:2263 stop:3060 length:798 start_codon:yes stop_codon:yes gene_type:complete
MEDKTKYILYLKTCQAQTFKSVIDALKEILNDTNFEFDEDGLRILAMDNSRVVLIHAKMEGSKFEEYSCMKKTYVGLNMLKLHMIIKTITNNDILTMYIEESDQNRLGIQIENTEKNLKTVYRLSMFDIDVLQLTIPPVDFTTTIIMPSVYFQKLIRDMHNIAEHIEIRNIEDKLFLNCKGEFCTQETVIGTENSLNINIIQKEKELEQIIQGVYSLKYISIFTKCTNLSNVVEIYLKNNYPLVLVYKCSSLGEIKLALSQITDD